MSLDKRKVLFKDFIESQFSYCPMIWKFHSRTLNRKIIRIYEKALRKVYLDFNFDELLEKDVLSEFITEMFKLKIKILN